MDDLDQETVITVGGWDVLYAVVRAGRTLVNQAAAVIDANGDGADINLEHFHRTTAGEWELCSSSGGAGEWGRGWHDGVWAEHDRSENGWWLKLKPGPSPPSPRRPSDAASYGSRAHTPDGSADNDND